VKPLRNVTILDLSKVFAGPFCSQQLSDLGAKVIKVEPVATGDDTRTWEPKREGQSSPFLAFNRNKRSLAVDIKSPEGLEVIHTLVKQVDVVLQSFKSSTAKKLQVDYDSLSSLNDKLIYCEITGYGSGGPLSDLPGYDVMLQAFGGIISTIGEPGGPHTRVSYAAVDIGTGMFGASSILAALLERSQSGMGTRVELSLLDTAISLMSYLGQNYLTTGKAPRKTGWANTAIVPYQAFRASDGDIMVGVGNDSQWQHMCRVFEREEWIDDPRLKTNADRVQNYALAAGLVQEELGKNTAAWWLEKLGKAGIPCAPIYSFDETLAHPHTIARGQIVNTDHPVLGELPLIGFPVMFNNEPRSIDSPPPLHGQHSIEILREAGYQSETINDLLKRGVVHQDGGAS
jgi:formyl-CoA transferase